MNLCKKHNQGYAIIVVLILIVIGTTMLVMFNRESMFFSKVAGFFSRSQKIQSVAQSGIDLAKFDLKKITYNSVDEDAANLDTFTNLQNGGSSSAFDMGLYFNYNNDSITRTLTPKISRTEGDYQLRVFYFPENPCIPIVCSSNTEYDKRLPKRFLVVSEVTNTRDGEVFTSEARIQLQFENYAEIAFGILGAGDYPTPPAPPKKMYYNFSPGVYGRSHFDLPADQLRFAFNFPGPDVSDPSQKFLFNDWVTFSEPIPNNQDDPFVMFEQPLQQQQEDGTMAPTNLKKRAMVDFAKGYDADTPLSTAGEEPSSDEYFSELESLANASGHNFSGSVSCPGGGKPVDICLKLAGDQIKQYNCNYIDNTDKIMGRIDNNIHPEAAYKASGGNSTYTHDYSGIFQPGMENSFPDRYQNERTDVVANNYSSSIASINANGVIYCKLNDCDCNIHIKGIIDGSATIAANNVVIEGDLQYQDQDPELSNDMLGIIAQKDVIVPPGIPQAAVSATSTENVAQTKVATQDFEPPVTDNTPGGAAGNMHEAYLGITNFIPFDSGSGQYIDRDASSSDYDEFINWDLTLTDGKRLNSATTLDLDAVIYAGGAFKVDTIFNPEVSADHIDPAKQNTQGIAIVTCENPPACTDYKYRNPAAPPGDPNAVYDATGALVKPDGVNAIQPLYYIDGLNKNNMKIGQGSNESTNANFNNTNFQLGEEAPRPLNRGIKVFGGITSNFHYIFDKMQGANGADFMMGFRRKDITGDPRTKFMIPPGYPPTVILKVDELYQKFHQGKSTMLSGQ
jgi:hypothetical protein